MDHVTLRMYQIFLSLIEKRSTSLYLFNTNDSGALKALEPIDMESYDMESLLTAERIINEEFTTTEIILGFVVSVRDPSMVGSTPVPVPFTDDGRPDWSNFADAEEIVPTAEKWEGITAIDGGILNLTVLREIDMKHEIIRITFLENT